MAKPIGLLTVARTFDPNNLYDYEARLGYGARGAVVSRSVRLGQRTFVESFGYTLDGAMTTLVTPRGLRQHVALNRANRLDRVTVTGASFTSPEPIIEKVTYNAKNQIESVAYRMGAKTTITYDPQTLLVARIDSSFKDSSGADVKLQALRYEVDGDPKITAIFDETGPSVFGAVDRSAAFNYDWRGQLTGATRYQRTTGYTYDASGNFTANAELGGAYRAGASTNLIPLGTDASPFDYDGFGRLRSSPELTEAAHDAAGMLLSARTRTGLTILYGYSADGTRYYKHVTAADGTIREALYPTASYSEEPSGAQSFIFVAQKRLVRFDHGRGAEADKWFFYLKDHLGSSDILMSAAGQPVEQNLYWPYGSEANAAALSPTWASYLPAHAASLPNSKTRHRFTEQYLDDETGLYYFGARYYHPGLGRFVTPDPLYLSEPERCENSPLDCSLYNYARNNPLSYVDSDGKMPLLVITGVGGAVFGALGIRCRTSPLWCAQGPDARGGSVEHQWQEGGVCGGRRIGRGPLGTGACHDDGRRHRVEHCGEFGADRRGRSRRQENAGHGRVGAERSHGRIRRPSRREGPAWRERRPGA